VRTRCRVNKLLFEGRKVIGLNYQNGSKAIDVYCKNEVILSAGTIGSPQILQLSGVGPKKLLSKFGISPVVELEGVGKNLQDHLQIRLIYKTSEKTLNDELNSLLKKLYVGFQYLVNRSGPLSLAASQVAIFTKSTADKDRPDIQFHMQPLSADKPGDGVHPFSAFTSSVCQLRPRSRGSVEIVSRDPSIHPSIQPNYLSHEEDRSVAIKAIKIARSICAQSAISSMILKEFVPGNKYKSDEDLLAAAMRFSQTIYHPVGTCKMGQDDMSVVDERLRVRGIKGLRIVDASIMPLITSGNTNAPTIMIAEKASDMIIEDS
jgi:choline dehydrogenase